MTFYKEVSWPRIPYGGILSIEDLWDSFTLHSLFIEDIQKKISQKFYLLKTLLMVFCSFKIWNKFIFKTFSSFEELLKFCHSLKIGLRSSLSGWSVESRLSKSRPLEGLYLKKVLLEVFSSPNENWTAPLFRIRISSTENGVYYVPSVLIQVRV